MSLRKLYFLLVSILLFSCGLPDTDALQEIDAETEALMAFPLPGFTYDKLENVIALSDYTTSMEPLTLPTPPVFGTAPAPQDVNLPLVDVSEIINLSDTSFFSLGGSNARIDEVLFTDGFIEITFDTDLIVTVNLSISALQKDGVSFSTSKVLDTDKKITIPLEGYTFNFSSGEFTVNIESVLNVKAGDVLPDPFSLGTELFILSPVFDLVKGYFGEFDLTEGITPAEVDLESLVGSEGNFTFGKTGYVLSLTLQNPLGIPMQVDMSKIYFKDSSNLSVSLSRTDEGNVFNVLGATLEGDKIVNSSLNIEFTSEDSNIDKLFERDIKSISIEPSFKVNPDGDTGTPNFLKSGIAIDISAKAQLALKLKI